MGDLARAVELATSENPNPPEVKDKRWWVALLVVAVPCLITSIGSWLSARESANAASAKAEAGYEAMRKAVEVLQEHDTEHLKNDAAGAAHIQAIEAWLSTVKADNRGGVVIQIPANALNKKTWRPNFPPTVRPSTMQRKVELPTTIDEVIADIKAGRKSDYVKEIYEGPADSAPDWEQEFERRAALKAEPAAGTSKK
ncbi:MAG TPA: hypothetical protein VFI56_09175 [Vicinamibacterales bacterium]|nr:hypothetical protein [Vicinamibacterales bacterium]